MAGLIVSHQRCGSSALLRFVRAATGAAATMEPFNMRFLSEQFPAWETASGASLSEHFGSVLRKYAVVKHIYGQHEASVDQAVFSHSAVDKIILLWREQTEAAALSSLIAKATQNWDEALGGASKVGYINPNRVRRQAQEMSSKRAAAIKLAEATGKPLRLISYEKLYEAPDNDRRALLEEVISFFSLTPAGGFEAAFNKYMARDKKVNSAATYRHIENVDELTRAFPSVFV